MFAVWRELPSKLIARMAPATVDVIVQQVDPRLNEGEARPFVHRAHGGRFLASDGVNLLTADYAAGKALAFIDPTMVARGPELRHNVLQLLALLLATQHDRVPLHAGAVVLDGRAILLAGRSTAGKSTLCYACLRDGFQLLSEDAVYVSRAPTLRLWGLPDRIHLLPDAVKFFPELAETAPAIQPTGKLKLAVETGPERAVRHAERMAVCIIERHEGTETSIEPIPQQVAVEALSGHQEPGFDLYPDAAEAARAVTAQGAYRLVVGQDLAKATAVLRSLG
jgi:hypothetical protein